jgi:NMD protein affecting ribosome stability and mRNA decay
MTTIVCESCGNREDMFLRPGAPLSQEMCLKCYGQGTLKVEEKNKEVKQQ